MSDKEELLCIGGVCDGQVVKMRVPAGHNVFVRARPPEFNLDPDALAQQEVDLSKETGCYRKVAWCADLGRVHVLVAEDMLEVTAIRMLIRAYYELHRAKEKRAKGRG